jgi:hypothetical protein
MDISCAARLPQFSDFEIICGSNSYRCNLAFLKAVCPGLAKQTDSVTFRLPSLNSLPDSRPSDDIVSDLLDLLYGRVISIPPENLIRFFVYGSILEVPCLMELGRDLRISLSLAQAIAAECRRVGQSADFLWPPFSKFESLRDLPEFTWYSRIHEKAEELLLENNSRACVQEVFEKLLEAADAALLPTLLLFLRTPIGSRYLRRFLSIPGIDLRQVDGAGFQPIPPPVRIVCFPEAKCDPEVKALLGGGPYRERGPAFEILFGNVIIQLERYRIGRIANEAFPTEWKIEGTMDGRKRFVIHSVGPGKDLEGGQKEFQLKHFSPPFKALRFTMVANSAGTDRIALNSFELLGGTSTPASFGISRRLPQ